MVTAIALDKLVFVGYFSRTYEKQWDYIDLYGETPTRNTIPLIQDLVTLTRADMLWSAVVDYIEKHTDQGVHYEMGISKEEYQHYVLSNISSLDVDVPNLDFWEETLQMIFSFYFFTKSEKKVFHMPVRKVW